MALIEKFTIPIVDPCPDYNPTPDADGFIPWITVTNITAENEKRLAAVSALLAVAQMSFKIQYGEFGNTAIIYVHKPDAKAVEVLWNLTRLVNVEAPPVLKININKMLATEDGQVFEQIPEIENNRFDDI